MTGFWAKAVVAGKSARLLLEAGDTNGAVNRAFFAMFDGARAALAVVDPELAKAKTHATIIQRFGQHVVGGPGVGGLPRTSPECCRELAPRCRLPLEEHNPIRR